MIEKIDILVIVFLLLILFYVVISFGAGRNKRSPKIISYMLSVRILIIIIAVVGFILWSFL